MELQCQVFRYANVVKGGPLGGSTWPALNHNDIYAARPMKLSKQVSPRLCLRQIFFDVQYFSRLTGLFLISVRTQVVRKWLNGLPFSQ